MNAVLNRLVGLRRDYLAVAALFAADFVYRSPRLVLSFSYVVAQFLPPSAPPQPSFLWQAAPAILAGILLHAVGVALFVLPTALAAVFAVRPPDHPMQNPPRPDLDARIVRVLTILLVLLVVGAVQSTGFRIWTIWTVLGAPAAGAETGRAAQVLGLRYFFDALHGMLVSWLMPALLWLLRRDYAARAQTAPAPAP